MGRLQENTYLSYVGRSLLPSQPPALMIRFVRMGEIRCKRLVRGDVALSSWRGPERSGQKERRRPRQSQRRAV